MTSTLTPGIPPGSRSRIAWAVRDTWVITCRDLTHWRQQPGAVIANTLAFPVMIVLMFGYLLGGAMTVPGGGHYRDFLMPGMFAMTMVFGIGATLSAVSTDAARGVTDRFRTLEFPIGFLGNPFAAVSTMPVWLGAIALWNPLSSTVTAARQLFGDPIGASSSWITSHAIIMAVAWPLLLTAAFFPLSLHRYQRLSR